MHAHTHIYIYIYNYITNTATYFGASGPSSGSFRIAFGKVIKFWTEEGRGNGGMEEIA